jgi:hypothetical protein
MAAVATLMDPTEPEHDRVSVTMLPHVVEVRNCAVVISTRTLGSTMVTIPITRHVDPPVLHAVHTVLSSTSDSPATEGQVALQHAMMILTPYDITSSLRGTTSISAMILHIAPDAQKDALLAVSKRAMRRESVM